MIELHCPRCGWEAPRVEWLTQHMAEHEQDDVRAAATVDTKLDWTEIHEITVLSLWLMRYTSARDVTLTDEELFKLSTLAREYSRKPARYA